MDRERRDGVVDLAARDRGGEVGAREVEGLEVEGLEQRIRHGAPRRPVGHGLERGVERGEDLRPDRARGVLGAREVRRGDDADRVDDVHRRLGARREADVPLADAGGRVVIRDDARRARGEPVHDAAVVAPLLPEGESVGEARLRRARRDLARPLEDEGMDPVGGELVRRIQSLIDEQGEAPRIRFANGEAQRPVLLQALRALHPVEHEVASCAPGVRG